MIWVYILTALLFLAISGFVILWYFKKHISTLGGMCIGLILAVVVVLLVIGVEQWNTDTANEQNLATYNELLLYYDVVNESNDELLRWDYYERIQKWNALYEDYLMGRESSWRSAFYGPHDFDNCDFIRLELRRE